MIELKGHNYLSIVPNRDMCKRFNPTEARPTPPNEETEGDIHLWSYLALPLDLNLYNRDMCKKLNPTDKLASKARPTPPNEDTERDVQLWSYLTLSLDLNLYKLDSYYSTTGKRVLQVV